MKYLILLLLVSMNLHADGRNNNKSKVSRPLLGAEGNGGALLEVDGRIVNFGSTRFAIKKTALKPQEVDFILSKLQEAGLDSSTWSKMYDLINYSTNRKYYNTQNISDEKYRELIQEYRSTYNIPESEPLLIGAITNVKLKETYILPIFYDPRHDFISRASLLLHESLWLANVNPETGESSINLETVVEIERNFESFARCQSVCSTEKFRLTSSLMDLFNVPNKKIQILKSSYHEDLIQNNLQGLVNADQTIDMAKLFGENSLKGIEVLTWYQYEEYKPFNIPIMTKTEITARNFIINEATFHLFELRKKYPKSFLISSLLELMPKIEFLILLPDSLPGTPTIRTELSGYLAKGISNTKIDFRKFIDGGNAIELIPISNKPSKQPDIKSFCNTFPSGAYSEYYDCLIPENLPRQFYLL